MAKRRTDSHCFAPGCRTGYPGAPKASLFAAPRDDSLRSKWERNLRRADKSLTESSAVCEHHFEAHCILREYVGRWRGWRIPRGKPSLAPDAISTLLPQCPAYLSVKTPQQRTERKRPARSVPLRGKKPRQDVRSADYTNNEHEVLEEPESAESSPFKFQTLRSLAPSPRWCRIEDDSVGLVFATSSLKKQGRLVVCHERAVIFKKSSGDKVCAAIYCQGVLCSKKTIASAGNAAAVLDDAMAMCVCKGAMSDNEFRQMFRL